MVSNQKPGYGGCLIHPTLQYSRGSSGYYLENHNAATMISSDFIKEGLGVYIQGAGNWHYMSGLRASDPHPPLERFTFGDKLVVLTGSMPV